MDQNTQAMAEEAYQDAYTEAVDRGESKLRAHMDAVVAASMLVSAMTGAEDEDARKAVVEVVLPSAKLREAETE